MRRFVALWPEIRDIAAYNRNTVAFVEPVAEKNDGQTAVGLRVLRVHDDCCVLQPEK